MFTVPAYAADVSAGASAAQQPNPMVSFLPLILIFVVFYFLLIRPQQKRQQEHLGMVKALKKNDEIITSGGIYGVIANVKDDSVMLRVDDDVKIEVQKAAIAVVRKSAQGS